MRPTNARETLAAALRSLRVVGAMGAITANVLTKVARGQPVERARIDAHARAFATSVIETLDVDLHVTGAAQLSGVANQTYVFVSNHQSHLDIPIIYASLPPLTLRMMAKRELFAIPVWGRVLRVAEYVEIDRANRVAAIASLARAATMMQDGIHIWMAPEGSRSRDGRIGPMKKGAFHLARATGAQMVPLAIDGTRHILPRGAVAMQRGVTVKVTIGAPIAPPTEATMDDAMRHVRDFFIANVSPHQAA